LADTLAFLDADAKMALARFNGKCSRRAMDFATDLKPGCFGISENLPATLTVRYAYGYRLVKGAVRLARQVLALAWR